MDAARIRLSIGYLPTIRLVTHLDIDDAGLDRAIAALRTFAA
jgi:threonine aldolase